MSIYGIHKKRREGVNTFTTVSIVILQVSYGYKVTTKLTSCY